MLRQLSSQVADETLGGRISLAREMAGLSLPQAAQRLGVLAQTWQAWECDRDEPRGNRLVTMAGVLGISPVWLLSGVGSAPMENDARHSENPARLLRELVDTSEKMLALNKSVQKLRIGVERLHKAELG